MNTVDNLNNRLRLKFKRRVTVRIDAGLITKAVQYVNDTTHNQITGPVYPFDRLISGRAEWYSIKFKN